MAVAWGPGRRGTKIGLALGEDGAVAVLQGRTWTQPEDVPGDFRPQNPGLWLELVRVFGALKEALELRAGRSLAGAEVHIALLPPLADGRVLSLPPMRRSEAEAVLARDVGRYFLGAGRGHTVAVMPGYQMGGGGEVGALPASRVFAAATSLLFLETIRKAVVEAGWRCGSMSAAHGIWAQAAGGPGETPAAGLVAVVGETAHVFSMEDSRPSALRRVDARNEEAVVEALGPGVGKVVLLADGARFDAIQRALAQCGWTASPDPEEWKGAAAAAAGRARGGTLEFLPPSVLEERRRAGKRAALGMGFAACVLLVAAAGIHLWGAHREFQGLQERRAAIRAEVTPALQARDSLQALRSRVKALQELRASSPAWTRSLVELSAVLPEDNYLTAFYASGDTVELEAAGTRAADAIQRLRESGLFEDLRLQGIVERELNDGETVEERFSLRGRMPGAGEGGGP